MNFIKKQFVFVSTFWGAVLGYIFLHPLVNIINEFFHRHKDDNMHLHLDEILVTFTNSFDLTHWPNALSYVILAGLMGYFFGKTITAYRIVNEQFEKFSKIGVHAASIIHDLNNPLTGIIAYIEILRDKINNPEQINYCDVIQNEATHISKMITDIKMLSKETETFELSRTPTNLKLFLEDIISKMSLHSKVKVDSEFEGKVLIDRDLFERVFWNLIKNADEALEENKNGMIEISVSDSDSDNSVTLCISDNGPGIPKKILKNLFKLGYTSGKKSGSGIGLYNCNKIVDASGGKIWFVSKVGKGTRAYVKIPK